MSAIYAAIQENPEYFAWAFGVVNVLWGLFVYFNKQSHDRAMARLKNDLALESERRKRVFELKASLYETYVANLDAFGRKHQVDLPARMRPIFDKYLSDYLAASESGDKQQEHQAITWFSGQVSALMYEGLDDVLKLQAESNRLKLTATDEMIDTFSELETLTKASMDKANEFMGQFTEIVLTQDHQRTEKYQAELKELGRKTQEKANELMQQMRAELRAI